MNDPADMEALAAAEHESWSNWTRYLLGQVGNEWPVEGKQTRSLTLREFLDLPCVQRWQRQMETTYEELSEKEKESDREVVREKLPLYRGQA